MPSYLGQFLDKLKGVYTSNVQPLFVDAARATKRYFYDEASQNVKDQWGTTINQAQQVGEGAKFLARQPVEFVASVAELPEAFGAIPFLMPKKKEEKELFISK